MASSVESPDVFAPGTVRSPSGSESGALHPSALAAQLPVEFSSRTCADAILGTDLRPEVREERMAALLEFFEAEGIKLHAGVRAARRGAARHALRATRDLEAGEAVLRVPRAAWFAFSSERAVQGAADTHPALAEAVEGMRASFSGLGRAQADDLAGVAALAVSLVSAAKTDGFYYGKPVVDGLPRVREAETPLTWHLSEVGELSGTHAWEAVLGARQTTALLHTAVFGAPDASGGAPPEVRARFGDLFATREELAWAVAMVNSRAGSVPALRHRTTLVPGMDLFRRAVEANCDAVPPSAGEGDEFVVRTTAPVEAGADLTLPLPPVPASAAFGIFGTVEDEDDAAAAVVASLDAPCPRDRRADLDTVQVEAVAEGGARFPDPRVPAGAITPPVLSDAVSADTAWHLDPETLTDPADRHLLVLYRLLDRYGLQHAARFAVPASGEPPRDLLTALRILSLGARGAGAVDADDPEADACVDAAHAERVRDALARSVEDRLRLYPTTAEQDGHILRLVDDPASALRLPMPFEVPAPLHRDFARIQRERLGLAVRARLAEKRILRRALRWEGPV